MAINKICHIEWMVTDLEKARVFYTGLFGWKFAAWSDTYHVFSDDEGFTIALDASERVISGNSPRVYIEVESIDLILKKSEDLGGIITARRTEIPDIGWYAILLDPDGNSVGLYEALKK